jgi:hypothetical protein
MSFSAEGNDYFRSVMTAGGVLIINQLRACDCLLDKTFESTKLKKNYLSGIILIMN